MFCFFAENGCCNASCGEISNKSCDAEDGRGEQVIGCEGHDLPHPLAP